MSEQLYKKINGEFVPFGPSDYRAFIEYYWSPGLWLVTSRPGCNSRELLHYLSDIPDKPTEFAGLLMLRDELATKLRQIRVAVIYSEDPAAAVVRSDSDQALDILTWLAEKQGVKQIKFIEPSERPERKIEPEL